MCGWGGEKGGMFGDGEGAERDCKWGQFIQSMEPARGEVCILTQRATTPSKRVNVLISFTIISLQMHYDQCCTCCKLLVAKSILSSAG